jgi:kumamolisin
MSARRVIPGSEKQRAPGAQLLGPADPAELAEVTVVLRMPPGSEADLAPKTNVGAAPGRGRHLTREEFEARFSASADDVIKVEDFARAHGLDVVEVNADRRSVVLSGKVAALSQAFGVQLGQYQHQTGKVFRGRTGTISVPDELGDVVTAVLGLDDRPVAKPHHRRIQAHAAGGALLPTDVARLYGFPADATGEGECIALVELGGGYRLSELRTYFTKTVMLPAAPKVSSVSVDGGRNKPGVDGGADGEVMLDIEVAGAVAPRARIVVYFAPNTDRGFLDAITAAIHDKAHHPSIISISWGSAESSWTAQALRAFDQAFQVASALGITVCAAAGDAGSTDGVGDGLQHVDFPASSPNVLACGGTRLVAQGGAISHETVWHDAADSATGGGVSDVFDLPAWQADANVPPSANPGHRRGRGVPDVAGDADPVTGYRVLVDGQADVIGGTSAVAPLWAGLVALANQKRGAPVGLLQPLLYANPKLLRDVTSGDNGAYRAGPGWDACTGLGSPRAAELVSALSGATATA